jgi:hypothetical protein
VTSDQLTSVRIEAGASEWRWKFSRAEELTLYVDSHNTACPVIKDGSHVENDGT